MDNSETSFFYVRVERNYFLPHYPMTWPEHLYVALDNTDLRRGFREFSGTGGHYASEYAYPLYRRIIVL